MFSRNIKRASLAAAAAYGILVAVPTCALAQTARWADAGVAVFFNPGGTGGGDYVQALRTAAQRWNLQSFVFEISPTGLGASTCGNAPGVNIMMAYPSLTVCGAPWPANQVGTTQFKFSSSGRYITTGDIIFNATTTWSIYTGPLRPGAMDLTRVAVHELGRLAGLPDSSDPASIMFPQPTNVETPTLDDLNALTALYAGVVARPLGGFACYQNTTPPFVGLGPVSGNYSVLGKCLDANHHSVDYSFSVNAAGKLTITLYTYHTEINLAVVNAQGLVLYSEVDDGKLQKSYTAQLSAGNYTVRLWREVAGSTYDLNFAPQ